MKKWILGIVVAIIAVAVFVVCGNAIAGEKALCYYKQELYFNDDEMLLEGKQVVGFYNYTDEPLNYVCLHLYPNAFRQGAKASVVSLANYDKAYPNGKSYGNIEIECVESNSEYLNYEICGEDENILKVEFGKELYPNELFEFEVGFSVNLPNINHRLGYGKNTINICNYYPVLCVYENSEYVDDLYNSNGDPFYSKCANFEVSITYDKKYTLASSGKQKNVIDGENKVTEVTAQNIRDFAMVLSSKFEVLTENHGGVEINYYYYGDNRENETLKVIKQVLDMNKKYGEYPYDNLSVVEASFVHGGMEYPNMVLISDDLADYETYINVVVHELCHQWWYGVVGNNQYTYGFLDEGLTDYNTAKFYGLHPEYGLSSTKIFNNASNGYATFEKVYSSAKEQFSTAMIRRLDEFETENEYVYLSYVKGMLMFATLEDMLGQTKMDRCLKTYYNNNKFSEATPEDLVDAFSKTSGKNLYSFFDSWFNGQVVIGQF